VERDKCRWLKEIKGSARRVHTYPKVVNVAFTRTASARLAAPASLIWSMKRLEGPPKHTTNPHADGRRYGS
jgi:hypothetical protein